MNLLSHTGPFSLRKYELLRRNFDDFVAVATCDFAAFFAGGEFGEEPSSAKVPTTNGRRAVSAKRPNVPMVRGERSVYHLLRLRLRNAKFILSRPFWRGPCADQPSLRREGITGA